MSPLVLPLPTLFLALALSLSIGGVASAQAKSTVFVSILPQKYFVERVAGDAVRVEVLVPPGVSPATHEPTPPQMLSLSNAQVWFRIGVPFEEVWAPRIQSNFPQLDIIDTRDGVDLLSMGHKGGRPDPHIWLSPLRVIQQSETIRDALIELLPDQAERFIANQMQLASDLRELDAELKERFANLNNPRFMIYHPALGYFADDYGLEQIPIEVQGRQPGPQTLTRIIESARAEGIEMIFVQQEFDQSSADAIAQAIGGEVVTLAPLAEDVTANMSRIADALLQAME